MVKCPVNTTRNVKAISNVRKWESAIASNAWKTAKPVRIRADIADSGRNALSGKNAVRARKGMHLKRPPRALKTLQNSST